MYNPQKIIDLLEERRVKARDLLTFLGKNWNGSVSQVVNHDIRVSKIERIADFFQVPIDTFFDRETPALGTSPTSAATARVSDLERLLAEKDKRIALLEDMVSLLKDREKKS